MLGKSLTSMVLVLCVIVGGCAGERGRSVAKEKSSQANSAYTNITPLSTLLRQQQDSPNDDYQGRYTRLYIRAAVADDNQNDETAASESPDYFGYDHRWWVTRFLVGKHSSTNLTVKVTAGTFVATVPLASIDHVSTKSDGESFNRIVYHQALSYPLFLVKRNGSNGIVSIKSVVKVSNQVQSGAAGAALSVAQGVLRAVAPQSTVLTTLTQQDTKNAATAVDDAVNKLFSASVDEEQWSDGDIRVWGKGVSVDFRIPKDEDKLPQTNKGLKATTFLVGRWNIGFENPRWSIFSDMEVCPTPNAANGLAYRCVARLSETDDAPTLLRTLAINPTDVLAFRLTDAGSDLGTVEAYIKKQGFYTTGLKSLAAKSPSKQDFDSFCKSIQSSVASLDLSDVDQRIITYSFVTGMSLPGVDSDEFKQASACQ